MSDKCGKGGCGGCGQDILGGMIWDEVPEVKKPPKKKSDKKPEKSN